MISARTSERVSTPVLPSPPPPVSNPLADIESPPASEGPLVGVGFVAFCILLLSGMLNDWALMAFGGKAYVSLVMVALTPALWLASGNALRGFRDRMGSSWVILIGLMLMTVPFSVWRSASLTQIFSYVTRSMCFYFYATSFCTSLKRCRRLMLVNIALAVMVLISCALFGSADVKLDDRFQIRGSMFVGNSNDLALNLTVGMTEFIFLFYLKGVGKRLLGIVGISLSLFYMLKTGSRGCVLALGIAFLFTFALSKQKLRMAMIAIPLLVISVVFMPRASARRILLIFHGISAPISSADDASALASQAERTNLLQQSLSLTLHRPLFGVGMGQFVTAVMGEAAKEGKWAANLGTHNSYTQVSSECGIPALIFYCSIIVLCFQRSYRLYQLAGRNPQFKQIEGLAFSLLIGTLVYAVATFFFHIAYSGLLPLISGEVMALYTIAYPHLSRTAQPERWAAQRSASPRLALQGR
jgi:hypothetical protein